MIPDERCEEHGEKLVLYLTTSKGKSAYRSHCKSCRREYARKRNGGLKYNSPFDPRCKAGHLKNAFNYGLYGGKLRCIACARERGRHKR